MTWKKFKQQAPELAVYGDRLLNRRIAYLALLNKDGSPRVHPVRPYLSSDMLFIFTDPASPKIRDFERDQRYALHASIPDSDPIVEFLVMGLVSRIDNPDLREEAGAVVDSPETVRNYVLFEFMIENALVVEYNADLKRSIHRWTGVRS